MIMVHLTLIWPVKRISPWTLKRKWSKMHCMAKMLVQNTTMMGCWNNSKTCSNQIYQSKVVQEPMEGLVRLGSQLGDIWANASQEIAAEQPFCHICSFELCQSTHLDKKIQPIHSSWSSGPSCKQLSMSLPFVTVLFPLSKHGALEFAGLPSRYFGYLHCYEYLWNISIMLL